MLWEIGGTAVWQIRAEKMNFGNSFLQAHLQTRRKSKAAAQIKLGFII